MADKINEYVEGVWTSSITPQLEKFITIPNQSPIFDPEWATNGYQEQVVDLFMDWLKEQPLSGYKVEVHINFIMKLSFTKPILK